MNNGYRYRVAATLSLLFLLAVAPGALAAPDPTTLLGWNGGNNDNPHNLSNLNPAKVIRADSTGDPNETRICVFCHVPHGATPQTTLWGRPDPTHMGSFATFDEANVKDPSGILGIKDAGIIGTTGYDAASPDYPNGATKLCLSCHDGATAIGTLADGTVIQMTQNFITDKNLYVDPFDASTMELERTHPVSFVYTLAVAQYLNAPAPLGADKFDLDSYVESPFPSQLLDSNSRLQCTSCHDPHANTRVGAYTLPFWRNYTGDDVADYDNTCAACHVINPGGIGTGTDMHNI